MRLLVGGVVAAIVMFLLGYVFFDLLFMQAFDPLAPDAAAAVQTALGSNIQASGTYMVPADPEGWMKGPAAMIGYVVAGGAPGMATAMIEGFIHMLISALIIGVGLQAVGGDFWRQARVVLWFGLAAAFFMHLGDPIWYGFGWRNSLFLFVADGVMFIAGGLVLARWFTSGPRAAA
jgi:hypothetical protein